MIHDWFPHGNLKLTLAGVIAQSSNIGTARASRHFESGQLRRYLTRFGLGQLRHANPVFRLFEPLVDEIATLELLLRPAAIEKCRYDLALGQVGSLYRPEEFLAGREFRRFTPGPDAAAVRARQPEWSRAVAAALHWAAAGR